MDAMGLSEVSLKRIAHFKNRLNLRHGVILEESDYQALCASILDKSPAFKLSGRVWLYRVKLAGRKIVILWDRKHSIPVTVLPTPAWIQTKNGKYKWDGERFSAKG